MMFIYAVGVVTEVATCRTANGVSPWYGNYELKIEKIEARHVRHRGL
jgi:hypothetical protein